MPKEFNFQENQQQTDPDLHALLAGDGSWREGEGRGYKPGNVRLQLATPPLPWFGSDAPAALTLSGLVGDPVGDARVKTPLLIILPEIRQPGTMYSNHDNTY